MALTKIQIISNALILLGKGPVTTIAGAGDFGAAADSWYDLLKESVLAKNNWRFATKIQALTKLVETPVVDLYSYSYLLPSDYLSVWRLYPNTLDFQLYGNQRLYSSVDGLVMEYRYAPDPSLWPYYFIEYFVVELAEKLALAVAKSEAYAQEMRALKQAALPQALNADAQAHPNSVLAFDPFIEVRGAGIRNA